MSSISFQSLKWNRFEMHRDPQKSTIDSWFNSPWNDRSKIPIKTHVRFTDETTVQNLQKSTWLFFVRFYRHKICRKARGRFPFASNDLKFAEKRIVVFRSRRPKNDRPKIRRKARGRFSVNQNDQSFSGRFIAYIFAQNDRGHFLAVPSVVGLAREIFFPSL